MKHLLITLFFLTGISLAQEKAPLLYPFTVTIGEQTATVKKHDDLFATIAKPVKATDLIKLQKESPLFIVNAFPCRDDGTVEDEQSALIIFAQNTAKVSLSDTKDKMMKPKAIPPGTYLANIVAHGKTSRVVFTVAKPGAKPNAKLPDFSKIMKFLKGKK